MPLLPDLGKAESHSLRPSDPSGYRGIRPFSTAPDKRFDEIAVLIPCANRASDPEQPDRGKANSNRSRLWDRRGVQTDVIEETLDAGGIENDGEGSGGRCRRPREKAE